MTFTVLTSAVSAEAAEDKTTVTYASFMVEEPFSGAPPASAYNWSGETRFILAEYTWRDEVTGAVLSSDDRYVHGRHYTLEVVLEACEGYAFDTKKNIRVSSNFYYFDCVEATPERCVARYSFLCKTLIDTASAMIATPVAGQTPSYEAVLPEDACYILNPSVKENEYQHNGIVWYELADNSSKVSKTMLRSDTFEAGKKYKVNLYISPKNENYYVWLSRCIINGAGGTYTRANGSSGGMSSVFVCPDNTPHAPLTVNISSFLSETNPVTVELIQGGDVKRTVTRAGSLTVCTLDDIREGDYTLRISKKDHVTREYDVTVSGSTSLNTKIHPIGDINGDGKVTAIDFTRANSHARGVSLLSGYELKCADVLNNDGKVTAADAARINSAARGVSPLW